MNNRGYTTLFYPTWMHIQKGCSVISRQVLSMDKKERPSVIVAIGPDGFIPGVILSNIIEAPILGINYRSQSAANPLTDGIPRKEIQIINGIKLSDDEMVDRPSILLIGAIVNSGHTMDEMYNAYSKMGHTVFGAALYVRDGTAFFPTMYWNHIQKNDPNIEFPWDI